MSPVCVAGGHLVPGHHGDRDDRWGAALLQRAATAGHAPHPGQPPAPREGRAQGQPAPGVTNTVGTPCMPKW